jgi:hypothetical protein
MALLFASDFSNPVTITTAPIIIEVPSVLYGLAYPLTGPTPTVLIGSHFKSNYAHVMHTHSDWMIESPALSFSKTLTENEPNTSILTLTQTLRGTIRVKVRYGSNVYVSFSGDPTPTQLRWSPWSAFMDVVIRN